MRFLQRLAHGRVEHCAAIHRLVVVVGPLPPPVNGAARVTRASMELLREAGCRVLTVDTGISPVMSRTKYHQTRILTHLKAITTLSQFRDVCHRVLYIGGAGGSGLWYQLAVMMLGSLLGYRIVFHHHSSSYITRRMLPMRLILLVPMHGGCHIALCGTMARTLRKMYRTRIRIETLSNSALLGLLPPRERASRRGGDPHRLTLGHLSNLTVDKGLQEVIRTLDILLQAGVSVSLLLAGPTHTEEATALVAEAVGRFGNSFRYLGAIPPTSVNSFMSRLDLFLFPSRYKNEAEPLVVLEALQAGVPVIVYDIGCLRESVGAMGTVIPPESDFAATVLMQASRILDSRTLDEGTEDAHDLHYHAGQTHSLERRNLIRILLGEERVREWPHLTG